MTFILNNLWSSLHHKFFQQTSRRDRHRRSRLDMEVLEDRTVPAVLDPIPAPIQQPDYQVNSYQSNTQYLPAVAFDAQGGHVVVWTSWDQDDGNEADGWGIFLQRYDAAGNPLEAHDVLVNTTTRGNQRAPAVAMADDGRFVVVWYAEQEEPGGFDVRGIYGRRYAANGTPLGDEFPIAAYTQAIATQPDVAMDADGNFVVTWTYDPNVKWIEDTDIHAQRYGSDGRPRGYLMVITPEFEGEELDQSAPAVAMSDDGKFVIAWSSEGEGGEGDVFARIYDSNGIALDGRLPVNDTPTSVSYLPDVAMDEDGDFVVVWNHYDVSSSPLEAHGRRYIKDPNLNRWNAGNEFRVHEEPSSGRSVNFTPSVAMGADGDFTVAWARIKNFNFDIYARDFSLTTPITNPSGARGDEYRVNNVTSGNQSNPAIAMDEDSDYVIAWNGNGHICDLRTGACQGDDNGVFLRRYFENVPPNLSIADQIVAEGQLLRFYLIGSDADVPSQSLTYSLDQAPPGAYISSTLGLPWPQFRWTPEEGDAGTYQVTIRVTDNGSPNLSDTETFTIVVTDNVQPPALASLDDQTLVRGDAPLPAPLAATDAEGDELEFFADAVPYDPLYALDQELFLTQKNGTYYENWMGRQEKWLWSSKESRWYYLLPNGNLHKWLGSSAATDPRVATVEAAVWSNPALLHEAPAPMGPVQVALQVEGQELFIYPSDQFVGTFQVHVTVSDGIHTDEGSFLVSVVNNAPEFSVIPDQRMSHSETLSLDITAYDANGDVLDYAASVLMENPLYDLDQSLALYYTGDYWQNWLGLNERWLKGADGWYYFTPEGDLYDYDSRALIDHVGSEVWDNPALLFDAPELIAAPDEVSVSIDESDPNAAILTVDPNGAPGEYIVTVTADDGHEVAEQRLSVTVTNQAPMFRYSQQFVDRTIRRDDRLVLDITADDGDGDALTYSAEVAMANPLFQLDQNLGLYYTGNYWQNWLGLNERWLKGADRWYYITPQGGLFRGDGVLQQDVGAEVWRDPSLLYDADEWISADGVSLFVDRSDPDAVRLTFDPAGYEGVFAISVSADDGIETTSHRFRVSVQTV